MLRLLLILAACVAPAGCRSQSGCGPFPAYGTRVPPPGTGSYGTPNTYYPNVPPRTSSIPGTAPRTTDPGQGGWRSAQTGSVAGTATLAAESDGNRDAESAVATAPRIISASKALKAVPIAAASSSRTVSSSPRLNGMRVNEATQPVAPASFEAPVDETEKAPDVLPNVLPTNGWQTRAAPAPHRSVGS